MKLIDNIILALIKRKIKAYVKRMKKMAEQEAILAIVAGEASSEL